MVSKTFLTPEQYLEMERKAEVRSEYYRGEMFAMPGGTGNHTMLSDNIIALLRPELRGGPCRAYSQNMRVLVGVTGLYTYPDIVVACGEKKFLDARQDTLLNPILVIEILSESTEAYDRGRKFSHYRTIESFQEYVLVSQDEVLVERYLRTGDWPLTEAKRLEDSVELESVGCSLLLADIYEDVNPQPEPPETGPLTRPGSARRD